MIALIRGELIKTVSIRTAFAYAAIGVALAVVSVLILTLSHDLVTESDKREAIAGVPILLVLYGLVGAAGEYRHRTAAPAALVAGPWRGQLLLARSGAYAIIGFGLGALMVVVTLALALPLLAREPGPGLGSADIAIVAGGSMIAAASCAIMGVAVGTLVRNQVAGVIGALMVGFVVTPLLATIDEAVVEFTPFGSAMVMAGDPNAETLSPGGAALVFAAWTIPLLFGAIVAERRRDLA